MNKKYKFPREFLWGAATSSYQIEGNNINSDWWEWEEKGNTKDKSGKACDYWNRFREDHEILQNIGVDSFRISIEWAKIEPKEGEFDQNAIEHYREILRDLEEKGIKRIVTFWHWTSPQWFQERYGLHNKKSVEIMFRYFEKLVDEFGNLMDIVVTVNEPMVPLAAGFLAGKFPPGEKSIWKFLKASKNLAEVHRKIYKFIKGTHPDTPVGISYLYNYYTAPENPKIIERIAEKLAHYFRITFFHNKIKGHEDYIGIDYYRIGKIVYDPKNSEYLGFRLESDQHNPMGWVTYPEGIYHVLKEAWEKWEVPIFIMENGKPTDPGLDDQDRIGFLKEHLKYVRKSMDEAVDVLGYTHWSLMDNFEWLEGFKPRFGLVEIDYNTLERKPRKSAEIYGEICKNDGFEE